MTKLIDIDMREIEAFAKQFAGADAVIGAEIETMMQKSLDILSSLVVVNTPVNTGALRQSIDTQVYGVPLGAFQGEVTTSLLYGEAVEYGRKPGKMPPVGAIKQWVVRKGIASGVEADSVAFLIARAIGRRGTKGAFMFKKGLEQGEPIVLRLWEQLPVVLARKLTP